MGVREKLAESKARLKANQQIDEVKEQLVGDAPRPVGAYDDVYRRSIENADAFWRAAAADIDWIEPFDRVLDDTRPPFSR